MCKISIHYITANFRLFQAGAGSFLSQYYVYVFFTKSCLTLWPNITVMLVIIILDYFISLQE